MRQLFGRATRRRNDEDIQVAVAIAREGNPFSIRRETRISIAGFIHGEALNVLTVFISGPNVAEIGERDAPVGIAGIAHQLRFARENNRCESEQSQSDGKWVEFFHDFLLISSASC